MSRYRRCVPALVGWAVGLMLAFYPMLGSGFARIPGDLGDMRLINYMLEHSYRWLAGYPLHRDYWSPPFYYPVPNVTAYTDTLLSVAPLYWVWRGLGILPDTSFQLWYLSIVSLNYWIGFLFLRNCFRFNPFACSAGAFLFAFANSRLAQISHAQLHTHFFSLLALYALYRVFEPVSALDPSPAPGASSPQPRLPPQAWIMIFVTCLTLQLYASFYLGWFLGLALAVAGFWAMWLSEARQRMRAVLVNYPWAIGCAVTINVLLLAPLALHYLQAARAVGLRSYDDVYSYIPTPLSWFYPGEENWLFQLLAPSKPWIPGAMGVEHAIGIGLITTAVAFLGVYRQRGQTLARLVLLTSASLFVCATLFPPGFTLWQWLFPVVPGAGAIRGLTRIGLFMLIPASFGLASYLQETKSIGLALGIALLCGLEQVHHIDSNDKEEIRARVLRLAQAIDRHCPVFLYTPELPADVTEPPWELHMDAMWAQLETGIPTINGYTGNWPPGWNFYDLSIQKPNDEPRLAEALHQWAVLHQLHEPDICRVKQQFRRDYLQLVTQQDAERPRTRCQEPFGTKQTDRLSGKQQERPRKSRLETD